MKKIKALLAAFVAGQDTPPTIVRNVDPQDGRGTFDIVYHPSGGYIERMCKRLGTKNLDNGDSANAVELNGCYDYAGKTMYLASPSEETVLHEWCHRNNPPKWDEKKNRWVYPKEKLNGVGKHKCR